LLPIRAETRATSSLISIPHTRPSRPTKRPSHWRAVPAPSRCREPVHPPLAPEPFNTRARCANTSGVRTNQLAVTDLFLRCAHGMIPLWGVIALSKQHPICSRRRRSEIHPYRQRSRTRPLRSNVTSCQRTCPTRSSISMIKNWTCSLRRVSKRRSGEADCHAVRQIETNPHQSGSRERKNHPIDSTWKRRRFR
jgi:hypothetical protein